ncbi:hypothetical protein N7481_008437 [Penicillium waksmanii]|uniref:uncharacterized protein n=1 Tax=Penicillium waksmanii TaxID=69791 RepID=UPI0025495ECA|nr:uncharacterized protein N7481_008437 [Penicillium waksmanii]KAJ5981139.1 hypothetical protein N7481_008437 [Penicillium waksmanii]
MTTENAPATTFAPKLPLTTFFKPPSSCDNLSWVSSDCLGSTCERIYNIVRATETQCYPSGWSTLATAFSPGIICPGGYSIAATSLISFGAASTETQATCCPSGFTVATENSQAWYEREPCLMRSKGVTTLTYTIIGTTPITTTAITYSNPVVHAMPIGIMWQSTDTTSSPTTTSSTLTTKRPIPIPTSAQNHSSLSSGAKTGIGIGVSIGVVAIALVFGAFFCFRRRRTRGSTLQALSEDDSKQKKFSNRIPTELNDSSSTSWTAELSGDQPGPCRLSN